MSAVTDAAIIVARAKAVHKHHGRFNPWGDTAEFILYGRPRDILSDEMHAEVEAEANARPAVRHERKECCGARYGYCSVCEPEPWETQRNRLLLFAKTFEDDGNYLDAIPYLRNAAKLIEAQASLSGCERCAHDAHLPKPCSEGSGQPSSEGGILADASGCICGDPEFDAVSGDALVARLRQNSCAGLSADAAACIEDLQRRLAASEKRVADLQSVAPLVSGEECCRLCGKALGRGYKPNPKGPGRVCPRCFHALTGSTDG